MPELRPYQVQIIEEVRNHFRKGIKKVLVQLATGGGKSLLASTMLQSASSKKMFNAFTVHRIELIDQVVLTFDSIGLPHDIVAAGFLETRNHYSKICSIGSLRTRINRMKKPNLVVVDECAHSPCKSWSRVLDEWKDSYFVGLTATPERLDGQGLGDHFQVMVKGPSIRWLIDNGYLSDYRIFAPHGISTEGIHTQMGDFNKKELNKAADKPSITGDVLNEYLKHAKGKKFLGFGVSRTHSKNMAEMFLMNGIPCQHIDSETQMDTRREAMRLFRKGDLLGIFNVDLFGEGVDVPDVECLIDARPTQSIARLKQMWGRALRPSPGKSHAIILDHAGNVERHQLLPDDEIEWKLEGRPKNINQEKTQSVKICPGCFSAQPPGRYCRYCGKVFDIKERKVKKVEGPLTELDIEALRKRKEQGKAQSYEDLVAVGIGRKMRNPMGWARHVIEARQEKIRLAKVI